MQCHHAQHQEPACLRVRSVDHGPEISHQKPHTHREAHGHKNPVQNRDWAPADQRDGNPDHVGITIQRPALDQARAIPSPEPPQQAPQRDGNAAGVAIDEAGGAAQELEVVHEMYVMITGEILGDGTGEEENEDDGGGNPERAVEVRVSIQDIEEGRARIECGFTTAKDFRCIHVKELGIKGECPQEAFGRGGGRGGERVAARVRRDFGAGIRWVCKVWKLSVRSQESLGK